MKSKTVEIYRVGHPHNPVEINLDDLSPSDVTWADHLKANEKKPVVSYKHKDKK